MAEVNLPNNWILTTLEEVVLNTNGARKPISLSLRAEIQGPYPYYGATGKIDSLNNFTHEGEHILIGEDGANLLSKSKDLAFIVNGQFWVNNHAHAVKCLADVPAKYISSYINSLDLTPFVTGSAQPKLTKGNLDKIPVPLPPLAEQKVIADKLDTLLAQVDNTKARLERIPEILKSFRQSVLAAAVSGKLTEEWRNGMAAWSEKELNAVAKHIVDCPHSTPKWSASGKYCVKTTAFNPFYLDLSEQGFVSEDVYAERIQRLKPEPGDILYSREGTVGIACQIPPNIELCLGQRMVLIRAGEELNAKFLTMVLNSDYIMSIVRAMTIGSTVPRVNMKDIRSYPIPVPSEHEQTEIVRRVEELFAFADRIEQSAQVALSRVNNLTQSILAKAFRGELTADWRAANPDLISGDNSAEALLAKIKTERAKLSQTKKGRSKSVEN